MTKKQKPRGLPVSGFMLGLQPPKPQDLSKKEKKLLKKLRSKQQDGLSLMLI